MSILSPEVIERTDCSSEAGPEKSILGLGFCNLGLLQFSSAIMNIGPPPDRREADANESGQFQSALLSLGAMHAHFGHVQVMVVGCGL